jgi:hypothetical protein
MSKSFIYQQFLQCTLGNFLARNSKKHLAILNTKLYSKEKPYNHLYKPTNYKSKSGNLNLLNNVQQTSKDTKQLESSTTDHQLVNLQKHMKLET